MTKIEDARVALFERIEGSQDAAIHDGKNGKNFPRGYYAVAIGRLVSDLEAAVREDERKKVNL
jgi:hypothetical protein